MALKLLVFPLLLLTPSAEQDDGYGGGPDYGAPYPSHDSTIAPYGGVQAQQSAHHNQPHPEHKSWPAPPQAQQPKKPFDAKKLIAPIVGGVAGLGALAGVIAVSAMKKPNATMPGVQGKGLPPQATAPPGSVQAQAVQGSIGLKVPDATFQQDLKAQKAVASGLADVTGVPPEYVMLTVDTVKAKKAQLNYEIVLPPADTMHSFAGVVKRLQAKSKTDLTKEIQKKISAAKDGHYRVEVTKIFVGSSPVVVALAPPAAPAQNTQQVTQAPPLPVQKALPAEVQSKQSPIQATSKPVPTTSSPEVADPLEAELGASEGKLASPKVQDGKGLFIPLPKISYTSTTASTTTTTTQGAQQDMIVNANTSATTSSKLSVAQGGSSSSGSSSSSGFNNGFMVGGITIAWVVVACCVLAFFLIKKKNKMKRKPSKETYMPDDGEYESHYMNSEWDSQPLMKESTQHYPEASPDMESQYMPVNHPDPASQYTGHAYVSRPANPPVSANQESLPLPPPAPTHAPQTQQTAPTWQVSPLASSHVPQPPPLANTYMPQVSPLANSHVPPTTMLPATTMPNGLIGMNLPPTMYG
jgi:hypothetical protein